VTGPSRFLGQRWQTRRAWTSAALVAGALCFEPFALTVAGRAFPGSRPSFGPSRSSRASAWPRTSSSQPSRIDGAIHHWWSELSKPIDRFRSP